jgi:hypothetical protein
MTFPPLIRTTLVLYSLIFCCACGLTGIWPTPRMPSPTSLPAKTASPGPPTLSTATYEPDRITTIDAAWNRYTNHDLGFAINFPRSFYHPSAGCLWHEDGDQSYRPQGGEVPTVIFEANDRIFITSSSYSQLTDPTQVPSGAGYRTQFAGCQEITNTLELARQPAYPNLVREIVVRPAPDEQALLANIRQVFGQSCKIGSRKPGKAGDVQVISMADDGLPPGQSTCPRNFGYTILYSATLQRSAIWIQGTGYEFFKCSDLRQAYDPEISASFVFLAP